MAEFPSTELEIDAFLSAFEGCTLPKERWTHKAHLLTGACYVYGLEEHAAIDKIRTCVGRYNESVGGKNTDTSGYHETITIAWIKLLANFLRNSQPTGRAAFVALALERFDADRDILRRYYPPDLLSSVEARRTWVAPTLASLE